MCRRMSTHDCSCLIGVHGSAVIQITCSWLCLVNMYSIWLFIDCYLLVHLTVYMLSGRNFEEKKELTTSNAQYASRHLHGYGLAPWVVSVGTCGYGYGYGCPYPWLYPYPHHGFPITSRGMKALIYIITMPMCSNLRIQFSRDFKQHCIIGIQLATRPKRTGLKQPLSGCN